jgi:hypothetical protein
MVYPNAEGYKVMNPLAEAAIQASLNTKVNLFNAYNSGRHREST